MKRFLFASLSLICLSTHSIGAVVSLTPAQINQGNTATTIFDNGEIRMTPFIRDANGIPQPATFNADATRLGIDGTGTNANAFNDPDTIVGNAGDELLGIELGPMSGLTQISWDFSRANGGPASGLFISGFLSNPNVTFTGSGAVTTGNGSSTNVSDSFDATTGILRINVNTPFGPADTFVNFDPQASVGQTLLFSVHDTDQAGAQLAFTGFSYDNSVVAIPEPSSYAILGLAGAALACRRRRRAK